MAAKEEEGVVDTVGEREAAPVMVTVAERVAVGVEPTSGDGSLDVVGRLVVVGTTTTMGTREANAEEVAETLSDTLLVEVPETLGEPLSDTLLEGDAVKEGTPDMEGLFDPEPLLLADLLAEGDAVLQAEAEGVLERDKVAEVLGVLETDLLAEADLLLEPDSEALFDPEGDLLPDPLAEAERVAVSVCVVVGPADPVEETVGVRVGRAEFVMRADLEAVRLAREDVLGKGDDELDSVAAIVSVGETDGLPVTEASGDRVTVLVAVAVLVIPADREAVRLGVTVLVRVAVELIKTAAG